MKKLVFTMTMLLTLAVAVAQPKIAFDTTVHNFGDIREEGGKVTARFTFKNVGDSDLILTQVKPGCGCTAANYTRDAVAPGQTGFIDATYDPWGRPNSFHKNIKVTTNEPNLTSPHLIFIKGNVIKRPPTKYELAGYKMQSRGEVKIKRNSLSADLKNTESQLDTIYIRNFYEDGRAIEVSIEAPAYIQEVYRSFGQTLPAGVDGKIAVKYDAALRNDWGNLKDRFVIITNDTLEPRKYIYYNVNLTEDFSHMTGKELERAPIFNIDKQVFQFDSLERNASVSQTFKITNTGRTPLILRKIQPSLYPITYTITTTTIEPGAYAELVLTYTAKNNRRGKQNLTVDIVTNDPTHPKVILKVEGNIK